MTDTPFVPIEAVSQKLTVSISTVRAWVRTGLIPRDFYIRIGNTYRFDLPRIIKHFSKEPSTETPSNEVSSDDDAAEQLRLVFGDTQENPDNDL